MDGDNKMYHLMPVPNTPIEEGFERIFGKMNTIEGEK
jgi:hypothetical protein